MSAAPPNGDMSELELRLLEAARADRIPPEFRMRMAEGLGVHAAGAAVHGALSAGGKVGAPWFAKTGLWGVLSLSLVVAGASWYAARSAPGASREPHEPMSSAREVAPAGGEIAPDASSATTPAKPEQTAAPATDTAPPARVRAAAGGDDAALRAEVALLDRARQALHAGEAPLALRLLDQHSRRFARGMLEPEATALRIEALVQIGSYEQAGAMSQRFVSAYPSHPLREHVAKLTATRAP